MELALRNSEHQRQESRKLPIGNTERLQVALNDKRIKDSSIEEISEILRLIMVKIGLRAANWPTPIEKTVLINHIVQNYGGNTGGEIKLAFEMTISGKLEVEANCYENFSCLYFSSIMNAYRKWAVEEKVYLDKSEKPKEEKLLNAPKMTDDEFIQMNYDTWKVLRNPNVIMVKEGKGVQSCFKILLDQGKIKRIEGEEREFVIKKATSELHEIWREEGINLNHEQKEKEIQTLCKKLLVQKYFLSL